MKIFMPITKRTASALVILIYAIHVREEQNTVELKSGCHRNLKILAAAALLCGLMTENERVP